MTRLEAIRGRAKAATAPPWVVRAGEDYFIEAPVFESETHPACLRNMEIPVVAKIVCGVSNQTRECGEHDAEFLAHAREDIPHLLALVDDLAGALRELVRQVKISGAMDEHGHDLKNLQAVHMARAALARTEE